METITERSPSWDGKTFMKVVCNDGGRAEAGYKGKSGDCVVRSIAIASGKPYQEVYDDLYQINDHFMKTSRSKAARSMKSATPRDGNFRKSYHDYIVGLGFEWVPTMKIGTGCQVHLCEEELPKGRLICRLSRHLCAVIDGVIHDTHDPQRHTIVREGGKERISRRCVYGYYIAKD